MINIITTERGLFDCESTLKTELDSYFNFFSADIFTILNMKGSIDHISLKLRKLFFSCI